jgi:hypothetical protein
MMKTFSKWVFNLSITILTDYTLNMGRAMLSNQFLSLFLPIDISVNHN